jgi:hypothetical protein
MRKIDAALQYTDRAIARVCKTFKQNKKFLRNAPTARRESRLGTSKVSS